MRKLHETVIVQILELRRAGNTQQKTAAKLGISQHAVSYHLNPQRREICRTRNRTHREEHREYHARRNEGIKLKILKYYGTGKVACVKCGEARLPCLSIDHIDGGGKAHKISIGKRGNGFYRWLIDQDFPPGYQTLCMNCQFIKKWENKEQKEVKDDSGGDQGGD